MYRGRSERCESALSTMIDLKGENPKCHIHPGGSARPAGYVWHFAHAVIQTKGNSNEDSAAGLVRVREGIDGHPLKASRSGTPAWSGPRFLRLKFFAAFGVGSRLTLPPMPMGRWIGPCTRTC